MCAQYQIAFVLLASPYWGQPQIISRLMTRECFEKQIGRLSETFGDKYYQPHRLVLIWEAVRNYKDYEFEQAVTRCIQTERVAPLVPGLMKALDSVIASTRQRYRENAMAAIQTPLDALLHASNNTPANKDYVQACLKLIRDKIGGRLSHAGFLEGCEFLEKNAGKFK